MTQSYITNFKKNLQLDLLDMVVEQKKQIETYEYCQTLSDCPIQLKSTDEDIRLAKRRLKFYIYSHNFDLNKMRTWHRKCNETEVERMETIKELCDTDKGVSVHCMEQEQGVTEKAKNEGGYILYCRNIQEKNGERENIMRAVTEVTHRLLTE